MSIGPVCSLRDNLLAEMDAGHVDTITQLHETDCELVIGLVGATGTDLNRVSDLLRTQLYRTGYAVEILKISQEVIPQFGAVDIDATNPFDRLDKLMTAGNSARETAKDNSILALGAAARIAEKRFGGDPPSPVPMLRRAVIVNSLKRPEEVDRLRQIYPNGFVLLGVYADVTLRRRALIDRGISELQADILMERDADERLAPYGQRLNKTFYLSDFFIRLDRGEEQTRSELVRLVELLFGHPNRTPTFDEYAMFFAFAAALRSADLSRQVGAVIARDNAILATGANDCPRAGGGLYWPIRDSSGRLADEPRGRDYTLKCDSNVKEQKQIVERIVALFEGEPGISSDSLRAKLKSSASPIGDLTEYGRVVHAEMDAITTCARSDVSAAGATLYCTTFPCHNCAKHIVAAGIERVVFIEPYPKSKALVFHPDAIVFDSRSADDRRVLFEPFFGVGPRRFFDLFSMNLSSGYDVARKKDGAGDVETWDHKTSRLRLQMLPSTYLDLEGQAAFIFKQKLPTGGNSDGRAEPEIPAT